jgi:dUTP pyrophosphatase
MLDNIIQLKIINQKMGDILPKYATTGSAGLDLKACIDNDITILPNETILIPTGIAIYIKNNNYCGMILPRSGLGHKHGIVLGNLVGLIDSDYQGEIFISLWNRSQDSFTIKPLDRLAQLVIVPILQIKFEMVDEFNQSNRGDNGFGSTGIKNI